MVRKISTENRLREVERKLQRSRRQISVLDRHMDILQVRYKRASDSKRKGLFSSFRIQLATLEGVREAFYLYACEKAAETRLLKEEMRRELLRTSEE